MTETSPFLAGLLGRCPRCGKGALFRKYLKVADACGVCGLDFSSEDSGDGPAVFVMSIVGFIVVPAALALELAVSPPVWLHMLLWQRRRMPRFPITTEATAVATMATSMTQKTPPKKRVQVC